MNKPFTLFALLESLPLAIFLVFAELVYRDILHGWLSTYAASSMVALITTIILINNKVSLNRLFIGINFYLYSGFYGLITDQIWLNELYGQMGGSGMLAWIIFVAIISLILSPTGFIGVKNSNRRKGNIFSFILLLIALMAFLFSYYFQGSSRLFSDFIPFVSLFTALSVFKSKLLNS